MEQNFRKLSYATRNIFDEYFDKCFILNNLANYQAWNLRALKLRQYKDSLIDKKRLPE